MDIKKVTGVYFSPAGSTKTVVETTVDELARLFKAECRYISLNTPSDRAQEYQFTPDELVVFGCPVYAGRLPNKISPDFARCLHGEGTPAVALVTYGGRAFDNALDEMCELLTKNNFKPAAGGAFLCRHVFSDKLAAGRPDAADLSELRMLAQGAALKLRSEGEFQGTQGARRCRGGLLHAAQDGQNARKVPQGQADYGDGAVRALRSVCENLPDGCD